MIRDAPVTFLLSTGTNILALDDTTTDTCVKMSKPFKITVRGITKHFI